jgi:hypothetical protein
MKNILVLLLSFILTISSFAQKKIISHRSETWSWIDTNWIQSSVNDTINLPITLNKHYIIIKTNPEKHILLSKNKQSISGENFNGFRYSAMDLETEEDYYIDIVNLIKEKESLLSVISTRKNSNIRYYYYNK